MRVIIAAAGTGGHINPGIAIANKIKEKENNSEIIFIGTTRGLENTLVPEAGYGLKTIEAYGLSKDIKKLYRTFRGIGQAKKIIKEFKPDIVIGTGGYICGPVVMAAKECRIPVLLHESNAFPGKAVKMLAKKADTICISFKEAESRIKEASNIIFTGTPVKIKKQEYSKEKQEKILKDFGISNTLPIVLFFGGSQGAKTINEAIIKMIEKGLNKNYQIVWATGLKQYDFVKEELNKKNININNINNAKVMKYIYNMEEIMNVCDVIVSRSGAMTITEISNLGKPSILIPLPNVSNNHQLYNAKVLEKIGGAKIILDNELNENILNESLEKIVCNKDLLDKMGKNAYKLKSNNVEEKIYAEISKILY